MSDADKLQNLLDRQALQDVMARYAQTIDERDLAGFRDLFLDDVEVHGFGREAFLSADAWCAFVEKTLAAYSATQHMLGPQLATIEGDEAEARTDLQAIHRETGADGGLFTLWGTYETRLSRQAGGEWKISRHALTIRTIQSTK